MKISIVIVEGAKQIMLTPQTEHEKQALKMINPKDTLKVVSRWGSFTNKSEHAKLQVEKCQGDYLRAFSDSESLMFLIEDSEHTDKCLYEYNTVQGIMRCNAKMPCKEHKIPQ